MILAGLRICLNLYGTEMLLKTGEVAVLSGSGARMGVFNRFSIGGLQNETKQRFELSFIQRLAGVEWSLPYGYVG